MSPPDRTLGPPRPMLVGAVVFAALAIAAAGVARVTGAGVVERPAAAAVAARDLVFSDAPDGGVVVRAAPALDTVAVLAPGDGGFVRGTLRALARQRRLNEIPPDAPFRLTRWADGRLTLDDPGTAAHVELAGFGTTNADAFAALLPAR